MQVGFCAYWLTFGREHFLILILPKNKREVAVVVVVVFYLCTCVIAVVVVVFYLCTCYSSNSSSSSILPVYMLQQ